MTHEPQQLQTLNKVYSNTTTQQICLDPRRCWETRSVTLATGCEELNIFGVVFGMTVTAAMFRAGLK